MNPGQEVSAVAKEAAGIFGQRIGVQRAEAETKLTKMLQTLIDRMDDGQSVRFSAQAKDGAVGVVEFTKAGQKVVIRRQNPIRARNR